MEKTVSEAKKIGFASEEIVKAPKTIVMVIKMIVFAAM
jgi:hypothetical protein